MVATVRQSNQLEQVVGHLLAARLGLPVACGIKIQILGRRQLVVHTEEIRHVAKPLVHLVGVFDDVSAVDQRPAGRRFEERRQDPQRRRLAGAVRSDEPEDLAFGHLEGDVVERGAIPVRLGQPVDGDHWTVPDSAMLPARKPPFVVLSRSRMRPVDGSTALSGRAVVPLSWYATVVQLAFDQSQTSPVTPVPACVVLPGAPNFGPYGFCALTDSPVRWVPVASVGANS